MTISELIICLATSAFTFVLGWLIGIERNNYLTKELTLWRAYAREQKIHEQSQDTSDEEANA
jgi:hypothetical protein